MCRGAILLFVLRSAAKGVWVVPLLGVWVVVHGVLERSNVAVRRRWTLLAPRHHHVGNQAAKDQDDCTGAGGNDQDHPAVFFLLGSCCLGDLGVTGRCSGLLFHILLLFQRFLRRGLGSSGCAQSCICCRAVRALSIFVARNHFGGCGKGSGTFGVGEVGLCRCNLLNKHTQHCFELGLGFSLGHVVKLSVGSHLVNLQFFRRGRCGGGGRGRVLGGGGGVIN